MGALVALSAAAPGVVTAPSAGAVLASGTVTVSPAAGPIGSVVHVLAHVSPGCTPSSGTAEVTLERLGQTAVGGVETLWTRVGPNGSFDLEYRIPTDLRGAATRGLFAFPVTAGTYQFRFTTGTGCSISSPGTFHVTGPAVPVANASVAIAATPDDKGYWLLGADGGGFAFGDAGFYGSGA